MPHKLVLIVLRPVTAMKSFRRASGTEKYLRVQAGFVELPGYPYGFLGGACGKLSADTLAFTGDLSTHPDHEAIVSFLRNYRVYPVCLQQGPLQDIGGILPLREEEKAEK